MCGIVGIISLGKSFVNNGELENFKNSLSHRGPDGSGTYISNDKKIGFGHTRLSILDLSNNSDQPMSYDSERYYITYNGEIYNFKEIKNELISLGYKFRSTGDTEVILASYKEWGEKCQYKFNGMWAFAIWDNKKNEIFISRDRFGVKPFFFLKSNNFLYFASELKSFMFINKKEKPKFDFSYMAYLTQKFPNNAYLTSDKTFLKNTKELPPGYQININEDKNIKIKKWWSTLDHLIEVPKNYSEKINLFKEIFYDSCKIRMRSDVETSTSLSGGLDSSSIVYAINSINNDESSSDFSYPHNTFILDYKNEKNNETEYALKASEGLNLKKNIIELDLKKINPEELIKVIYHQEEVTGDDGLGPWNIYKNIKNKNIKVSIDGHGGDELLAGYSGYPRIAMKECSSLELFRWLDLLKIHLKMNEDVNEDKHIIQILLNKFIKKITNSFFGGVSNSIDYNIFNHSMNEYSAVEFDNLENLSLLNKELYIDYHYRAMQHNLNKYDKFSMAHGVECRFPFLDWRLATYLFSLKSELKIKDGYSKKILRDSMKGLLNKQIINRVKKKGFNPANELFNTTMVDFINDVFLSNEFQEFEFFDKKKIHNLMSQKKIEYKNLFKYIQIFYLNKTFSQNN